MKSLHVEVVFTFGVLLHVASSKPADGVLPETPPYSAEQKLIKDATCASIFGMQPNTHLCLWNHFIAGTSKYCKDQCMHLNSLQKGFAGGTCLLAQTWPYMYQCHCDMEPEHEPPAEDGKATTPTKLLFSDAFINAQRAFNKEIADKALNLARQKTDIEQAEALFSLTLAGEHEILDEKHKLENHKLLEAHANLNEKKQKDAAELQALKLLLTEHDGIIGKLNNELKTIDIEISEQKKSQDKFVAEMLAGLRHGNSATSPLGWMLKRHQEH